MSFNSRLAMAFVCAAVLNTACDSLSDVGEQSSLPPTVQADVIGSSTTVRKGSLVLLSGKESEGRDSPIVNFDWTQTEGPTVSLLERSADAVVFTAPDVGVETALGFQLTVTDANNQSASTSLSLQVVPVGDGDSFLRYLSNPSTFQVVAATGQGIAAGAASDTAFVVSVQPRVTYPGRDGVTRTYLGPEVTQQGAWLAATGSTAADDGDDAAIAAFNNPRFVFDLPSLDMDIVNEQFLKPTASEADRQGILDPHLIDEAKLDVLVTLTCLDPCLDSAGLDDSVIYVLNANEEPVTGPEPGAGLAKASHNGYATKAELAVSALRVGGEQETLETAQAYYRAIDPGGMKTTMDEWLAANCMDRSLPDWGADAHTVYTNNFDLGFGRDMYIVRDCGGVVASIVVNYVSLEAAAKKLNPFLAVAMEYGTTPDSPNTPFTRFYVFSPDRTDPDGDFDRVSSANFDGRGEKSVPGVCTVCHGGRPPSLADYGTDANGELVYPNAGNIGSIFMPWDLDSFLYSDTDPTFSASAADASLRAAYTQAAQEGQFKILNEIALLTVPDDAPVRALVEGWYGGAGLPGSFDGSYLPPGWVPESQGGPAGNPDDSAEVYEQVLAQNCRACHTQLYIEDDVLADSTLGADTAVQAHPNYTSYASFLDPLGDPETAKALLVDTVLDRGVMPFARLTMDRFWVDGSSPAAADKLLAHLGMDATAVPGRPEASIGNCVSLASSNLRSGTAVRLDGASSSRFASTYSWTISARPPASTANLVGPQTAQPGLMIDAGGNWEVSLTVGNSTGDTATSTCQFAVLGAMPVRSDAGSFEVAEQNNQMNPLAVPIDLQFTDGDTLDSALQFTVTSCPNRGVLAAGMMTCDAASGLSFTQADLAAGIVTYQHDGSEPTASGMPSDSFRFTLVDAGASLPGEPVPGPLGGEFEFSIFVTPVNDAPTINGSGMLMVFAGGEAQVTASILNAEDVDTDEAMRYFHVTAAPMSGALSLPSPFTQENLDCAQGDMTCTSLLYMHAGGSMSDSFTVVVNNDSTGPAAGDAGLTVDVTVSSFVPVQLDVVEDVVKTIEPGNLMVSNAASEVRYVVTRAPAEGVLNGLTTPAGESPYFTQADVMAGSITYAPNANRCGSDSVGFDVLIGGVPAFSGQELAIAISAVNDPPVIGFASGDPINLGSLGLGEAALLSTTDLQVSDRDDDLSVAGCGMATPTDSLVYSVDAGTLVGTGEALLDGTTQLAVDTGSGALAYRASALAGPADPAATYNDLAPASEGFDVTVSENIPDGLATASISLRADVAVEFASVRAILGAPTSVNAGCVSGGCHDGGTAGAPNFALSLSDNALCSLLQTNNTVDTNLMALVNSGLLTNPSDTSSHGGNLRDGFDLNGDQTLYDEIFRWLREGGAPCSF